MARNPIILGTLFAALAAVAFGVTTPFIQRLGVGVGPFTTAALLYLGAAIGAISMPGRKTEQREARVRLRHLPSCSPSLSSARRSRRPCSRGGCSGCRPPTARCSSMARPCSP